MAEHIRLTENWVAITSAQTQPLYAALDVLPYDSLDLVMHAAFAFTGVINFQIQLITAMDANSESGWVVIPNTVRSVQAHNNTGPIVWGTITGSSSGGFYRYLRWQVTA